MTREQILQQQSSARIYQERYDNTLAPWGFRADAPTLARTGRRGIPTRQSGPDKETIAGWARPAEGPSS
jgi:hypothetical protein